MKLALVLMVLLNLILQSANSAESFLAVYVNLHDVVDPKASVEDQSRSIADALDRMKSCGLNTVLPYATTTSGDATYPSQLLPRRLYGDRDLMAVLVGEAHSRGLKVYPAQCVLACGGEKLAGILLKHPEWALRDALGEALGSISPAHPKAREWVASVSREIVERYQPDGLLLDYLRFPNQPVQLDPESAKDSPAPTDKKDKVAQARFQEIREAALTEQARLISKATRAAKPGLRIALYSWGPHVVKNHNVSQNWPLWAERGYVDNVNLSGYCFPKVYGDKYLEVFTKRLTDAAQFKAPVQLTFALGIKTSHGEISKASDVKPYLDLAARTGMQGTAVFTWGHLKPFVNDFERGNYLRKFEASAKTPHR